MSRRSSASRAIGDKDATRTLGEFAVTSNGYPLDARVRAVKLLGELGTSDALQQLTRAITLAGKTPIRDQAGTELRTHHESTAAHRGRLRRRSHRRPAVDTGRCARKWGQDPPSLQDGVARLPGQEREEADADDRSHNLSDSTRIRGGFKRDVCDDTRRAGTDHCQPRGNQQRRAECA